MAISLGILTLYFQTNPYKSPFLMGKSTINGHFPLLYWLDEIQLTFVDLQKLQRLISKTSSAETARMLHPKRPVWERAAPKGQRGPPTR